MACHDLKDEATFCGRWCNPFGWKGKGAEFFLTKGLGGGGGDDEGGDFGFADHAFGDAAEEEGGDDAVAVAAEDDEVGVVFFDVLEEGVEGTAFDEAGDDTGDGAIDVGEEFFEFMGGAAFRLFLEGVHGGEFVRREAVCGVGGFGFEDVEEVELCAVGFGEAGGHGDDAGGGV